MDEASAVITASSSKCIGAASGLRAYRWQRSVRGTPGVRTFKRMRERCGGRGISSSGADAKRPPPPQ